MVNTPYEYFQCVSNSVLLKLIIFQFPTCSSSPGLCFNNCVTELFRIRILNKHSNVPSYQLSHCRVYLHTQLQYRPCPRLKATATFLTKFLSTVLITLDIHIFCPQSNHEAEMLCWNKQAWYVELPIHHTPLSYSNYIHFALFSGLLRDQERWSCQPMEVKLNIWCSDINSPGFSQTKRQSWQPFSRFISKKKCGSLCPAME